MLSAVDPARPSRGEPTSKHRRPSLTNRVLRGLQLLMRPGVSECLEFDLNRRQRAARRVTAQDLHDARAAKNWVQRTVEHRARSAKQKPPGREPATRGAGPPSG